MNGIDNYKAPLSTDLKSYSLSNNTLLKIDECDHVQNHAQIEIFLFLRKIFYGIKYFRTRLL